MLSLIIFFPLVSAVVLALIPASGPNLARWFWVAVTTIEVGLAVWLWAGYSASAGGLAYEQQVPWIPTVRSSYHVGLDGLSLPLVVLTNIVFLADRKSTRLNSSHPV